MAVEEENPKNNPDPKPIASPSEIAMKTSALKLPRSPSLADAKPTDTHTEKTLIPRDSILSAASNIASQPLQYYDPDVWGVLTAISESARKRRWVSPTFRGHIIFIRIFFSFEFSKDGIFFFGCSFIMTWILFCP